SRNGGVVHSAGEQLHSPSLCTCFEILKPPLGRGVDRALGCSACRERTERSRVATHECTRDSVGDRPMARQEDCVTMSRTRNDRARFMTLASGAVALSLFGGCQGELDQSPESSIAGAAEQLRNGPGSLRELIAR